MDTINVIRKDLRKLNAISKMLQNLISALQALDPVTRKHLNRKAKVKGVFELNDRIQDTILTLKSNNSDER